MRPDESTPAHGATRNTRAIAVLRIAIGLLFLTFAQYKVLGQAFVFGGGFQYWINRFLQDGAYPFMVPVLRGFVLPHATPIALLVACSELVIGLSLALGIFTRAASVGGFIYMMTLLVSANYPGSRAPIWQYFGASLEHLVLALCFATFICGDPEVAFSVTKIRSKRH